jgi:hypothetical protein
MDPWHPGRWGGQHGGASPDRSAKPEPEPSTILALWDEGRCLAFAYWLDGRVHFSGSDPLLMESIVSARARSLGRVVDEAWLRYLPDVMTGRVWIERLAVGPLHRWPNAAARAAWDRPYFRV